MPPTMWKEVHNRVHHNHTNSRLDPDRNFMHSQPNTWGKWIQNAIVPSSTVNPLCLVVGMTSSWGIYCFRHLTSVLLFNRPDLDYVPASFTQSSKERFIILGELIFIGALHLSIITYLNFNPLDILLGYLLPIWIGYSMLIFYIFTNHLGCRMTSINDPLVNSISITVPKIFDLLHLNFSYHAEHHIFPGINSDYYPLVRELLKIHYPERMGYTVSSREAWKFLRGTPRLYLTEDAFTGWSGTERVACHANCTTNSPTSKTAVSKA
jgi:fatty acid desaturase